MTRHPRYRLSKLDLLGYALRGACFDRGISATDSMTDEEAEMLDKDIAEIERRIKIVETFIEKKEPK